MTALAQFEIRNKLGMHARAATVFVQKAHEFESEILVRKDGLEINGKSIMGVLQLAATRGQTIEVEARGADCEQALLALGILIADFFGEDE